MNEEEIKKLTKDRSTWHYIKKVGLTIAIIWTAVTASTNPGVVIATALLGIYLLLDTKSEEAKLKERIRLAEGKL